MSKHDDFNDKELFRKAMKDVKRLKPRNTISEQSTQQRRSQLPKSKPKTSAVTSWKIPLSDFVTVEVGANAALSYHQPGISSRYFRKLKEGNLPIENRLDLHGKNIEQARETLCEFLLNSHKQGYRCVHIIHGKGIRGQETKPILKNKVNHWLRQIPMILAFCSCQPKDGGTGAVYVLLAK